MDRDVNLEEWAKTAEAGEQLELPGEPGIEIVEHIEKVIGKL